MPKVTIDSSAASVTLVAAPGANKFVRINAFLITALTPTTVEFKDGDNTSVSGPIYACQSAAGGAIGIGNATIGGLLDVEINKLLKITNSGSAPIGGFVDYSIMG